MISVSVRYYAHAHLPSRCMEPAVRASAILKHCIYTCIYALHVRMRGPGIHCSCMRRI